MNNDIKGKNRIFNTIVTSLLMLLVLAVMLPLLHVLASSLSSPSSVATGKVLFWPVEFTLSGFASILRLSSIWLGFFNTMKYTLIGTFITITLQFTCAYALARKEFKARNIISIFLTLTMFVSGGMIPTYMVVKSLNMINTIWAVIIPGCVSVFNIIIIRTYIVTVIPKDVMDAASIDGCGDWYIFTKIVLPLCGPIFAVMVLYSIVGYWNSYFNAQLYLTDDSLYPLQKVLQNLLISANSSSGSIDDTQVLSEQLKYVTIVISAAPLLILYPFFQKYFEKGMMVGSVKG